MTGYRIDVRPPGGTTGVLGFRKVADNAARLALIPLEGDFVIQLDTDTVYYYNGVAWEIYLDDSSYDDLLTVIAGLAAHLADGVDAHDASAISVVPAGNLSSIEVQAALQELQGDIDAHLADAVAAHAASAIAFTPAGNIAAIEVQAAIEELDSEKANTALSNLNATSINQDLLPNGDLTKDLGASGFQWSEMWAQFWLFDGAGDMLMQNLAALGIIALQTNTGQIQLRGGDSVHVLSPFLDLNGSPIVNVLDPVNPQEAATKAYVDLLKMVIVANSAVNNATTFDPADNRRQVQQISGNAAAVALTDLGVTDAQEGDELILLGTDNTNTVTLDSATNAILNGSITLGLNDQIKFIFANSKWRESSRSA